MQIFIWSDQYILCNVEERLVKVDTHLMLEIKTTLPYKGMAPLYYDKNMLFPKDGMALFTDLFFNHFQNIKETESSSLNYKISYHFAILYAL